jgi:hypothetical protein
MNLPESKQELLDLIQAEHAKLDTLLTKVTVEQMQENGIPVGWGCERGQEAQAAIRDVLAHLSAWEARMLAYLALDLEEKPLTDERFTFPTATFNALLFEESQTLSLETVLQTYQATYASVLATLESIDEPTLLYMNGGGLISYNTYSHYRWAIRKMRPWIRQFKR